MMIVEIGSTVEGTVVKVADYGAVVRLAGGKMGLVHISEVAETFVRDVHDFVKENDRIAVKVLRINNKGRYELSAKQAGVLAQAKYPRQGFPSPHRPQPEHEFHAERPQREQMPVTFEDKLSRFMKDSQERLMDVKRGVDAKRGIRRK
jgi:S1 RNA binding domain protein